MPLSEFLRLAREKLQSDQHKQFPTDLTSRAENGVVELVCENGQIMKQGQSNRIIRNPDRSSAARVCVAAGASSARIEKSGGVESISNDILSGDCVLGQDEEMVAWLNNINNPIDDALLRYRSGVLPEISGVTANGPSNQNNSTNKGGSFHQNSSNVQSNGNGLKDSSSKSRPFCSWIHQQGTRMNPSLGSGVSGVISNNTSNHVNAGNGSLDERTVNDSTSIKMASNTLNFSNFSRLSRQATNFTPNLANCNGILTPVSIDLEGMEVKEKDSTSVAGNPVKFNPSDCNNTPKNGAGSISPFADCAILRSRQETAKVPKESFPERTAELCQQSSIKNDNTCRGVQDSEGTVEPEVASSSVGSGYSADRMSYERTHNSKRKYYDIEESECHGDDIGTEFGGVRKTTRGGTGSKRGRPAEVHNLSERRRRDRINERMRALQELIPNCNKVDKASMLDEAIEYLQTLQFQVQIMSMGTSLCMPQMMFPTAFQQMFRAQMPHYNPPFGMSIGMGSGMGMVDMNRPVPPMHGAHFPSHMSVPVNFQGLSINPLVPLTGQPPITPTAHSGNLVTVNNSRLMHNAGTSTSINHRFSYQMHTTNDVKDQSVMFEVNKQATDVLASAALTSTKATGISKVDGQV